MKNKRVALITGSGRGIGRAIAERLAHDGFDIIVTDLPDQQENVEKVVSFINKIGRNASGICGNVANPADIDNIVTEGVNNLGSLDVFVANAAIVQIEPMLDVTPEQIDNLLAVNVNGVFYSYQAAARQFIKQGDGGKIIGAASFVSFRPFPLLSVYSMSKWAVRGLTQAAAMELAEHGITVNAYAPGIVETPMLKVIDDKLATLQHAERGTVFTNWKENILLKRTSVPTDPANLVSFLASKDSDYITGQTMIVDGGIQFS